MNEKQKAALIDALRENGFEREAVAFEDPMLLEKLAVLQKVADMEPVPTDWGLECPSCGAIAVSEAHDRDCVMLEVWRVTKSPFYKRNYDLCWEEAYRFNRSRARMRRGNSTAHVVRDEERNQ